MSTRRVWLNSSHLRSKCSILSRTFRAFVGHNRREQSILSRSKDQVIPLIRDTHTIVLKITDLLLLSSLNDEPRVACPGYMSCVEAVPCGGSKREGYPAKTQGGRPAVSILVSR